MKKTTTHDSFDFNKKLFIYGAVLAALVVLFIVGSVAQVIGLEPAGERLFPDLKAGAVEKISVTDAGGRLEILMEEGAWKILSGGKKFDADKTAVESLIDNVGNLRKKNTVTNKKENWSSFSVDEAGGVHIVLSDEAGAVLADCFFGKAGATSSTQYVRRGNADEVIQTDSRIDKNSGLKEWVERRLFAADFAAEEVADITMKTTLAFSENGDSLRRSFVYTLVPGEKNKDGLVTWKLKENDRWPLSANRVNVFLSSLSRFTAENVVAAPEDLHLDPTRPLGSLVINLKSGSTYTLFLLGKSSTDPNSYYITNQENKYVYLASNWSLKDAFRGVEGFVDTQELFNP